MKSFFIHISIILLLYSCHSADERQDIRLVLSDKTIRNDAALDIIDNVRRSIKKEGLIRSIKSKRENGIDHQYVVYSNAEMPLIIESTIFGESYTINTTYYTYDSIPYFISSKMRDQYRQSGNFTHQEQVTYLNGRSVILQLNRSITNTKDKKVDLSDILYNDVTSTLIHPTIDARNNNDSVNEILSLPNE